MKVKLLLIGSLLAASVSVKAAAPIQREAVTFLERSWFLGRDYFFLQSGRTRLIVQSDKVDIAPAFLFAIFDSRDCGQQCAKSLAFNWGGGQGFADSALEVRIGGHFYTAVGQNTVTRWTRTAEGIPAVEAQWWAGGIRVTEQLFALTGKEAFVRRITLESANMAGKDQATIRLALPDQKGIVQNGVFGRQNGPLFMALGVAGDFAKQTATAGGNVFDIGPVTLEQGAKVTVDTLLLAQLETDAAKRWMPPMGDGDGGNIRSAELSGAIKETADYWKKTSSTVSGDLLLCNLYNSAASTLPSVVADNGIIEAGPFEYAGAWVRDSANLLAGAIHAGHFEAARTGLDFVLTHLVNDAGHTCVDGRIQSPDNEELDQLGELLHTLKAYRDWTGDDSLIRKHSKKIIAVVELPLQPRFLDPSTGMIHNHREYWERAFDEAYELIYQANTVLGLRLAADLAEPLGVDKAQADAWRAAADKMWNSVLNDPKMKLVDGGKLIKRRNVDGKIFDLVKSPHPYMRGGGDDPMNTELFHAYNPDSASALPIALGVLDPHSEIAKATLADMERIWNERWTTGGYGRYATSSEVCQNGPWPLATFAVMRAQHDAGMMEKSRRSLEWLATAGPSGAWTESFNNIVHNRPSGPIVWATGEMTLFAVRHVVGVRFEGSLLVVKPAPYPGNGPLVADLRFRKGRLKIETDGDGPFVHAEVNGKKMKLDADGALRLPADFAGGTVVFHKRR
jgi:hypothetical protein